MSRCFPYPPPGYELKSRGVGVHKSLIESIKLQKEKERAKKERRKDKKREKKDSSRKEPLTSEHKECSHKKQKHDEKSQQNQKDGSHAKGREDAIEQLEKSGLTEESGPPSVIETPYDSDSTQDYRKRQKVAPTDISHKNNGTILRIKLPLVRHSDAELPNIKESEPPASSYQPCFSGRVDTPLPQEAAAEIANSHSIPGSSHRTRKMERKFGNLFVNWNPPPMESEQLDNDDLGWLLGKREQKSTPNGHSCKVSAEVLGYGSSAGSLQPRACYLPEIDMYVLPYAVPY